MEDSHGQIWTQLVAASEHDDSLSRGTAAEVEQKVMEALQLSGETKIPVRRLVTIWRNARWKTMATKWCGVPIGRETFKISTWEWMISCRMDDYWFSGFHNALRALDSMPEPAREGITAADWKRMTTELPRGRTEEKVHELFYPTGRARAAGAAAAAASRDAAKRRVGFLAQLDDAAYREVYEDVVNRPGLRFRDLRRITGLSQEDGRVSSRVIHHLVSWVMPEPTVVPYRRSNKKPPLRSDLARALGHCDEEFVQAAEKRLGGGILYSVPAQPADEEASILLQQEVVDFTLDNLAELRGPEHQQYLDQTLKETDATEYAKRFKTSVWAAVLSIARGYFGDNLPQQWTVPDRARSPPPPPSTLSSDPRTADILQSFRTNVLQTPGLAGDTTLVMSEAFQAALVTWYSQGLDQTRAPPRPEQDAPSEGRADQVDEPDGGLGEGEGSNGRSGSDDAPSEGTPPPRSVRRQDTGVPSQGYSGRTARRLGVLRGMPDGKTKKKPGWMQGPRAVG
ncbi:hypothetical protein VDGD_21634 [Verticillium dahliae]|nr:hypothetical protein VDGD_21634 [Verticillium dahliae]